MKQSIKCNECGKSFFTTMLNIFVFKQHVCAYDKATLIVLDIEGERIFACPKCQKAFHKNVAKEYNAIGTRIQGSTRDFLERDKRIMADHTLEFDKVLVPEKTLCLKCRNYQTKAMQATAKRERKEKMGISDNMRIIPDSVSDADIYKYELFRRTQEAFQEARKAEAYEKQKAERAAAEAERKVKLAEQAKAKLLPTKEEMQQLVEPEMIAIEKEAQAKDIRIAEAKKRLEEEAKIKVDLEKKKEEIAKLKEKLEEAKKE